jgi:hypothetical protein
MDFNESFQNQKIELIQWLTTIESTETIEKLVEIKNLDKLDWAEDVSEAEKASILKGLDDVKKGKTMSHEDLKKRYENWI